MSDYKQDFDQFTRRVLEDAKSKMRIAVVHSGDKTKPGTVVNEIANTRFWKSYKFVAEDISSSLKRAGFKHVEVMKEGIHLIKRLTEFEADLVWANSGGVQGRASICHLPAMLELAGIDYIGHDPANSLLLDQKHIFKWALKAKGIKTPSFFVWPAKSPRFTERGNKKFYRNFGTFEGPFIVKPTSGRASQNVEYVENVKNLGMVIEAVNKETQSDVLIERFLNGREFTVSIMPSIVCQNGKFVNHNNPFCFSRIERILSKNEKIFTSMDVKPITAERAKLLDFEDSELILKLDALATQVFTEFNLETLVRVDFRVDMDSELNILEVNPKPDLKRPLNDTFSLSSLGLEAEQMTYDDLILSILSSKITFGKFSLE